MSKHDDTVYLSHIRDSIQKIEEFVAGYSFATFHDDVKTIDAVIRNFEIIGEASNNVSESFKDSHPEIDFRSVISFRNHLAHGYDDIKLETVWDTINKDLPALKKDIEKLV